MANFGQYDSTDRLREKHTRGGRGSKIPKILRNGGEGGGTRDFCVRTLWMPP